MKPNAWQGFLLSAEQEAALSWAGRIGGHIAEPDRFQRLFTLCGGRRAWRPGSFASGLAGAAMLSAALAVADPIARDRFLKKTHEHLKAALSPPMGTPYLFSGIAGLLAAIRYIRACNSGRGYESTYRTLLEIVRRDVADRTAAPDINTSFELGAGVAGEILAAGITGAECPSAYRYYNTLFASEYGRDWLRTSELSNGRPVKMLGIAHGVAGALAAVCSTDSLYVDRSAADSAVEQLLAAAATIQGSPAWPVFLDGDEGPFETQAWCHGSPGIVLGLYAVACELKISALRDYCVGSLRRISASRLNVKHLGLCHGILGNGLMLACVALAEDDVQLKSSARGLVLKAIRALEKSYPDGVIRDVGPLTDPTFLTGAAGIGLGLLTVAGAADDTWLSFLGIRQPIRRSDAPSNQEGVV